MQRLRQPKIGTALQHVFLLLGFKKSDSARVSKVPNLFDKMLVFVFLKPIYFRKKLPVTPVSIVLNIFSWVFGTFKSVIYNLTPVRCRAKLQRFFFCTWNDFQHCASGCRRPTISIRSAVWSKLTYGWNGIACSVGLPVCSVTGPLSRLSKINFSQCFDATTYVVTIHGEPPRTLKLDDTKNAAQMPLNLLHSHYYIWIKLMLFTGISNK